MVLSISSYAIHFTYIFLTRMSVQDFCQFVIGLLFSQCQVLTCLYVLDTVPLSDMRCADTFFPSM